MNKLTNLKRVHLQGGVAAFGQRVPTAKVDDPLTKPSTFADDSTEPSTVADDSIQPSAFADDSTELSTFADDSTEPSTFGRWG